MLECPRKDCSKQYKEEEGLKWHLSHSHPEFIDGNGQIKDTATVEREQEERKRRAQAGRECGEDVNSVKTFPKTRCHQRAAHSCAPPRSTSCGADRQVEGVRVLDGDSEQPLSDVAKPLGSSPPAGGGEAARGRGYEQPRSCLSPCLPGEASSEQPGIFRHIRRWGR